MELEIFVHGTPNGHDYWGEKSEDKSYSENFYVPTEESLKYIIQSRVLNDKHYCYYNYLKYGNVVSKDGRQGAYFGISIRIGGYYCKDVANMFRILDTVFNIYIVGTLLKQERTNLKYLVSKFSEASDSLEKIHNIVIQMFKEAFSKDSFISLNGFSIKGNNSTFNLYDCTEENVMSILKRSGIITISPYYPNIKEKNIELSCNSKIQSVKQQCDSRIAELMELRRIESEKSNSLNQKISQKEDIIRKQTQEISQLKNQIVNYVNNRNIAELVSQIKKPITDLAIKFEKVMPTQHEGSTRAYKKSKDTLSVLIGNVKTLLSFVNFLLLLLVIVFLVKLSTITKKTSNEPTNQVDFTEQFNNQQQDGGVYDATVSYPEVDPNIDNIDFNIDNVVIDIEGYHEPEKLVIGTEYKVTAKNGAANGKFNLYGCEEIKKIDNNTIVIKPVETNVIITYKVNDKEKKLTIVADK